MSSLIIDGLDYTPVVDLAKSILNGSYLDNRFTDAHKKVLQVFVDNATDFGGELDLFNTLCVGDFYYQSCTTIDDNSNDLVLLNTSELADMFFGNIDIEINYKPVKKCEHCNK